MSKHPGGWLLALTVPLVIGLGLGGANSRQDPGKEGPKECRVLVVTAGNQVLGLFWESVKKIVPVKATVWAPEELWKDAYRRAAVEDGAFDLVIFDGCAPKAPDL